MQHLPQNTYTKTILYLFNKIGLFYGYILAGVIYGFMLSYDPVFTVDLMRTCFVIGLWGFVRTLRTSPTRELPRFSLLATIGLVLLLVASATGILNTVFLFTKAHNPFQALSKTHPDVLKYVIRTVSAILIVIYLAFDYKKYYQNKA